MARSSGTLQLALPEFSGVTRRLVLLNLGAFFTLLILMTARIVSVDWVYTYLGFSPSGFLSGKIWQLLTFSFVQMGVVSTLFALLFLWFIGSLLEEWHGGRWLGTLYAVSLLGSALTATVICVGMRLFGPAHVMPSVLLMGCNDALFGLLAAVGILHGDVEFRLFFLVAIKAKYMAVIFALLALASAFSGGWIQALATLGAGAAALVFVRRAPRRAVGFGGGIGFSISERWYGLRNSYYRWKRRRAASKFQVYMKKHGRTVRFDGQGRLLDDDDNVQDDKKRWN